MAIASRRYIWKQIVRKRYCRPGTKTNLNIRTILPHGRHPMSVVKTCKPRAPLSRTTRTSVADNAHPCRVLRAPLSRTTRTYVADNAHFCYRSTSSVAQCCIATGIKGTSLPGYSIGIHLRHGHLYNCETIANAIPVRTVARGLCSMIRPLRTYEPCAHRRIWLIVLTQP